MDIEQALKLLGLAHNANRDEIESQFKSLAGSTHPDKGGTDDDMAELLVARDTVLGQLNSTSALVPISALPHLMQTISAEANKRQEIEKRTASLQSNFAKKSTNQLRKYRKLSTILGALAVAAFFLGKELPKELLLTKPLFPIDINATFEVSRDIKDLNSRIKRKNDEVRRLWLFLTFGIGAYAGAGAWFFTTRIERVEQDLLELDEAIGIKANLYSILYEILGTILLTKWTLLELEEAIHDLPSRKEKWHKIASIVGAKQFAQLLALKAQQIGLVEINERMSKGGFSEHYSLLVKNNA